MSVLIRPRQRVLTGVFPHAGNSSVIVPKRGLITGLQDDTFSIVLTPADGDSGRLGYRNIPGLSSFGAVNPDQAFGDFISELNFDASWLSIAFGNKELPSLPIVHDPLLLEDSLFPEDLLSLDYIADPLAVGRYRLAAIGPEFDARRAAWAAAILAGDDIDIILRGSPAEVRYDEYLLTIGIGTGGNVGMRNRPGSGTFGSISNDDGPNGTIIRESQIDNSGLMQLQWGLTTDAGGEGRQVYFNDEAWLFDSTAPTIGDDLVDIALTNIGTGRYRPSVGDQNPRRTRWLLEDGNEITLTVYGRVDPDNTLFPPP